MSPEKQLAEQAWSAVIDLHEMMRAFLVVENPGATVILKLEEIRAMREKAQVALGCVTELEERCKAN